MSQQLYILDDDNQALPVSWGKYDEWESRLSAANEQARALDFTLMLFDGQLSLATRELAAEELEELLKSEINRNYILDILLAVPLHDSADTSGSVESTSNSSLVRVFVQSILDVQERVRLSYSPMYAPPPLTPSGIAYRCRNASVMTVP